MHLRSFRPLPQTVSLALCLGAALCLTARVHAATGKKNPTSKFYVADVDGDAEIDTGDKVDDLNKKSVYNAEGTVVETKPKAANAMVFSNGTGIFFDEDTRVEVKKFDQEPFVPNRTDMDVEPSVSQTQAYVPRGTVGLCTSKLVAGSSMNYSTPLGSVNIRGGKVVIQNVGNQTKISMLDGDSTVSAGDQDTGGRPLKNGQQAVITAGTAGQPSQVQIQDIPSNEQAGLQAKVTMACTAKKTVYFEAVGQKISSFITVASTPVAGTRASAQATEGTAFDDPTAGGTSTLTPGPITAFDGDSSSSSLGGLSTVNPNPPPQIIAVPVTPVTVPVQDDPSPNTLSTPTGS